MAAFTLSLSPPDPESLALNLWATSVVLRLPYASESPGEPEKAQMP